MTDLTKITTAFGLLDAATRGALEEHYNAGLPTQVYCDRGWRSPTRLLPFGEPARVFRAALTFRAAPLPPTLDEMAEALREALTNLGPGWPRSARETLARYDESNGDEA